MITSSVQPTQAGTAVSIPHIPRAQRGREQCGFGRTSLTSASSDGSRPLPKRRGMTRRRVCRSGGHARPALMSARSKLSAPGHTDASGAARASGLVGRLRGVDCLRADACHGLARGRGSMGAVRLTGAGWTATGSHVPSGGKAALTWRTASVFEPILEFRNCEKSQLFQSIMHDRQIRHICCLGKSMPVA